MLSKDTTIIILNKLGDKDLTSMRLVSKYFNNIMSDDMFWLIRIKFLYDISIDVLNKYKKHRSWYKYYIYDIRQFNDHDEVDNFYHLLHGTEKGRLDWVIMSLKPNEDPTFIKLLINKASASGYVDIVKYLIENVLKTKEFNIEAFNNALNRGHVDLAKYLINYDMIKYKQIINAKFGNSI